MFFLPNTTSFAWSVLMPVWEWQADELPPLSLQDAVQDWFEEAPSAGNVGTQAVGDSPAGDDTEALPSGKTVLEAVALALAALPWQAPQEAQREAAASAPAEGPATEPTLPAAALLPPVPLPLPAPALAVAAPAAAAKNPVRPSVAPAAATGPTGRWVLAGWRDMPSYSLLRNVAAERVAEQPGAEDVEHTLSTERQRRHPGCGQP